MAINRRAFIQLGAGAATVSVFSIRAGGINVSSSKPPIIDVHMHAYPAEVAFPASLNNPATGKPTRVKNGEEHLKACLAEMKRLNIVKGVVSGGD